MTAFDAEQPRDLRVAELVEVGEHHRNTVLASWRSRSASRSWPAPFGARGAGGGQPGQPRWRNALAIAQLTISLVLLVGAGLFLRSSGAVGRPGLRKGTDRHTDPHDAGHPVHARRRTRLPPAHARPPPGSCPGSRRSAPSATCTRTRSAPRARAASTSTGSSRRRNTARSPQRGPRSIRASSRAAGIELLRGRNFNDATDRPDTQPVAIISEAMARRFWTDGDAVGRLVRRREN